jgi:hypothetical protein
MTVGIPVYCYLRSLLVSGSDRRRDERGEGVISAAIAVLIVAALGALMWVGFRSIWQTAESNTNQQISQIGG